MLRSFMLMTIAFVGTTALGPLAFILNVLRKTYRGENIRDYFETIAIGFDQAGGSILYSQENFTISSYTYFLCKYKKNRYACTFKKFIDSIFGENHCRDSYFWEAAKDMEDLKNFSRKL